MANWCSNTYTITSTKEEIGVVFDEMTRIQATSGRHQFNLVDIFRFYGFKDDDIPSCRGYIPYYEADNDRLIIDTETAWGPLHEGILELCRRKAPNAEIVYTSEEPGFGIYLTNDPANADGYMLDIWDEEAVPKALCVERDIYTEKELEEILLEGLEKERRACEFRYLLYDVRRKYGESMSINQFEFEDFY